MLRVKTYIDKSKTSGIGLFASEDIPKGKIVWEYFPLIDICFDEKQWFIIQESVDPHSFEQINKYKYKENGLYYLCTDNAQFMNHHDADFNITDTNNGKSMQAIRKILKGEELLCNYYQFCDDDDSNLTGIID